MEIYIYIYIYQLASFWCDSTAGSAERTLQGNNYGNVNSGYEYDKTNGQDHSTEMVTFKGTNPAQTPGIAINDSSMTKVRQAQSHVGSTFVALCTALVTSISYS